MVDKCSYKIKSRKKYIDTNNSKNILASKIKIVFVLLLNISLYINKQPNDSILRKTNK